MVLAWATRCLEQSGRLSPCVVASDRLEVLGKKPAVLYEEKQRAIGERLGLASALVSCSVGCAKLLVSYSERERNFIGKGRLFSFLTDDLELAD